MDDADTDDRELMLRFARTGDERAFEVLYQRHNAPLQRYCERMLRVPSAAEDVVHETWTRLVEKADRYEPTAKFNTFLYCIARNLAIDRLRALERRPEGNGEPEVEQAGTHSPFARRTPGPVNPHRTSFPERDAGRMRLRELLDEALSQLPDNQREVFVLHHEGELSLQEIADVLGQPRETVKSRYRYALGKIRDALPLDDLALALGRSGGDAPTSRA
jgi:RNA polymerase sigma-70 factor (ECF subfamily)